MNIRRFRALHDAGASYAEIAHECGCDWRTVRKYLAEDAPSAPPTGPPRAGTQPLLITPFIPLVEAWLRADLSLKGTVIHERLVAEYGFTGHYQRVRCSWPRRGRGSPPNSPESVTSTQGRVWPSVASCSTSPTP